LAERVIPVALDIDEPRNADLALRHGVRGVPTLLLVDAQGTVLARGGFMSAEALVEFLRGS
jgi:thioredoxin-related protein